MVKRERESKGNLIQKTKQKNVNNTKSRLKVISQGQFNAN